MDKNKIGNLDVYEDLDDVELLDEYAKYVWSLIDYPSEEAAVLDLHFGALVAEFFSNPTFNSALEKWYASKGKTMSEEVGGYMPYKQGFIMVHGRNYDWMSKELCGGKANGVAWKEFEDWIEANNIEVN